MISQDSYKDSLQYVEVEDDTDNKRGLSKPEFKSYRGQVGKLTWLSEMSRPDPFYDTLDLAGHGKNATVGELKKLNKVVKKAKDVEGKVRYSHIGEFKDLKILAKSDGTLNKREDRTQSVMGKMVFLANKESQGHSNCLQVG